MVRRRVAGFEDQVIYSTGCPRGIRVDAKGIQQLEYASTAVLISHRQSSWSKAVLAGVAVLGSQAAWFSIARYAQSTANSHLGFGHPIGVSRVLLLALGLGVVVWLGTKARVAEPLPLCVVYTVGALSTAGWCLHLLTIGCEGCRTGG